MKTKNIQYIESIFGKHIDSDRLTELTYSEYTKDNEFAVYGDSELILEVTMDLYNTIYEEDSELISKYIITTDSYKDESVLGIIDKEIE